MGLFYVHLCMQKTNELKLQVFDNLTVTIKLNNTMDGYTFKTPKGWGGRHYYSLCNYIDNALEEQYSDIYYTIQKNISNS